MRLPRAATAALTVLLALLLVGCQLGKDEPAPPACDTLAESTAMQQAMARIDAGTATTEDVGIIKAQAQRLRSATTVEGAPTDALIAAAAAADAVSDGDVTDADRQAVATTFTRLGEELNKTCDRSAD